MQKSKANFGFRCAVVPSFVAFGVRGCLFFGIVVWQRISMNSCVYDFLYSVNR